jgi:hypothetical protein
MHRPVQRAILEQEGRCAAPGLHQVEQHEFGAGNLAGVIDEHHARHWHQLAFR